MRHITTHSTGAEIARLHRELGCYSIILPARLIRALGIMNRKALMLSQIKSLLRPVDKLTCLAKKDDRADFEKEFVSWSVVVLQAPAKELDPNQMDEATLLREIESATQALSEAEEIIPYTYVHTGVKIFPLFSSQENAQTYIAELSKEKNKIIPFGSVEVLGQNLLNFLWGTAG